MVDPKKLDINQLPKKFVDGAIGSHGKEGFSFVLTSGNELSSFMTTPIVMKNIAEWMGRQIEDYQKKFGEIDNKPQPIVSPLQASDLDKPGDKGESKP